MLGIKKRCAQLGSVRFPRERGASCVAGRGDGSTLILFSFISWSLITVYSHPVHWYYEFYYLSLTKLTFTKWTSGSGILTEKPWFESVLLMQTQEENNNWGAELKQGSVGQAHPSEARLSGSNSWHNDALNQWLWGNYLISLCISLSLSPRM